MMSVRKSLGRACSMGLRAAEKLTLGRSRPPHTSQIHCWDTAGTPFRTVSLGTLVSRANPEPLSRDCDNGGARIRMSGWEGRTHGPDQARVARAPRSTAPRNSSEDHLRLRG